MAEVNELSCLSNIQDGDDDVDDDDEDNVSPLIIDGGVKRLLGLFETVLFNTIGDFANLDSCDFEISIKHKVPISLTLSLTYTCSNLCVSSMLLCACMRVWKLLSFFSFNVHLYFHIISNG
jgi:hypothetical protein